MRRTSWFYALEGAWTVYVGGERVNMTPGSFAFGPMGVPHIRRGEGSVAWVNVREWLLTAVTLVVWRGRRR